MSAVDPVLRSHFVRPILQYVESRGCDPRTLIERCELPQSAPEDGAVSIPLSRFHRFTEAAAETVADPFLGVHAAIHLARDVFGVIEFCVRNSPTIGEAYHRLARYNPFFNDLIVISFHRSEHGFELRHSIPGHKDCLGRHGNEMLMCFLVSASEQLIRAPFRPERYWFAHPAPSDASELAGVLRAERIDFGAGSNGFAVSSKYADQAIVSTDIPMLAAFDEREAASGEVPDPTTSTAARLRGLFHEALRRKIALPDLHRAAKRMGIGGRTLQRYLSKEGTTFNDVREAAREELARVYIEEPRLNFGEVAYLLGFREVAELTRAFRRWTGMTPKEFRRARSS